MMNHAVVVIVNPNLDCGFGSGFFISEKHIITCAHVLKNYEDNKIKVLLQDEEIYFEIINICNDIDIDLALLYSPYKAIKDFFIFTDRTIFDDPLQYMGYDIRLNEVNGQISNIGFKDNLKDKKWISFNTGIVIDGYSGGPLINRYNNINKVIGVIDISLNKKNSSGGAAISHITVDEYCRLHKVYLQYDSTLKQSNENVINHINSFEPLPKIIFERNITLKDDNFNFNQLIFNIQHSNLTFLKGEGGYGKSVLFNRIILAIANTLPDKTYIISCTSKNWNPLVSNRITIDQIVGEEPKTILRLLIDGFSKSISDKSLDTLGITSNDAEIDRYFFVDGLNEIASKGTRNGIIFALQKISDELCFKIIVNSRDLNTTEFFRWDIYSVNKLSNEILIKVIKDNFNKEINEYTERNLEYLSIPFFLDIAIKNKNDIINSYSEYISQHLLKAIPQSKHKEILNNLSEIAFNCYKSEQKFIIQKSASIDEKIIQEYSDYSIIVKTKLGYKFEHHLVNELLVAFKVSKEPDLWNKKTFDLITLDNRVSMEVMQMILEQIETPEIGEQFLLKVYNWNFYAVLHCLKYVDYNKYSSAFAQLLILLLTEKLFDRFLHTKRNVLKYLKPLFTKFEIKGLDINNLDDFINSNPTIADNKKDFLKIVEANSGYFINHRFSQ